MTELRGTRSLVLPLTSPHIHPWGRTQPPEPASAAILGKITASYVRPPSGASCVGLRRLGPAFLVCVSA